MPKPQHVFLVLAPIFSLAAWFFAGPGEGGQMTLGLRILLTVCFGLVPAALIAVFWTMGRGLFLPRPTVRIGAGELVVGHAPANHRVGAEMRGGRLFVTDRALHFVPHRFNVQLETRSLSWEQVCMVRLDQSQLGSKLTLEVVDGEMEINLSARSLTAADFERVVQSRGAERIAALEALRFAPCAEGMVELTA
ncbi:MAG: hypothetical protein VX899_20435 [Myxococcota bacterium]|nr:hypothetical protein [Myxococcota bacterium]